MVHREAGLALIAEAHRAVHALGLAIDNAAAITQAEALVLMLLYTKGSAPLDDVHRAFLHRRSTLTNVLARLESRNLVSRKTNPADRRHLDLSLTASGRKKAQQIMRLLEEIVESSGVTEAKAAESQRMLAKIARTAAQTTTAF